MIPGDDFFFSPTDGFNFELPKLCSIISRSSGNGLPLESTIGFEPSKKLFANFVLRMLA